MGPVPPKEVVRTKPGVQRSRRTADRDKASGRRRYPDVLGLVSRQGTRAIGEGGRRRCACSVQRSYLFVELRFAIELLLRVLDPGAKFPDIHLTQHAAAHLPEDCAC